MSGADSRGESAQSGHVHIPDGSVGRRVHPSSAPSIAEIQRSAPTFDPFFVYSHDHGVPLFAPPLSHVPLPALERCWRQPPSVVLGFTHADASGRPYRPDDLPDVHATSVDSSGKEHSVSVVVFSPDAPCVEYNQWWDLGQPVPIWEKTPGGFLVFTKNILIKQAPIPFLPQPLRRNPLLAFELLLLAQYTSVTLNAVALFSGDGGGAVTHLSGAKLANYPLAFAPALFLWVAKSITDLFVCLTPLYLSILLCTGKCMQSEEYRTFKNIKWVYVIMTRVMSGQHLLVLRRRIAFKCGGVHTHKDGSVSLHPAFLAFELAVALYTTIGLILFAAIANGSASMWLVALKSLGMLGLAHSTNARLLLKLATNR